MYLAVSVAAQKKGTNSIYPIGIYRWNPTIFSSSFHSFGISKDTDVISLKPDLDAHVCICKVHFFKEIWTYH